MVTKVSSGRKTQRSSVKEVHILWITAGLGCDGESVSITAATQPGIEDIVMSGLPNIPKVRFLNPFYSYENADEYIAFLESAEKDKLNPFILVIEGSIYAGFAQQRTCLAAART